MAAVNSDNEGNAATPRNRLLDLLAAVAIVIAALVIGTHGLDRSGPQWPDSPRYANAGAMVYDWFHSGDLFRPIRFAHENYCQYPSFSVPYHPPLYPSLLGLGFLPGGVSYEHARFFVALALGACGLLFVAIGRALGQGRGAALAGCALLLTTPEMVRWSRDTMSEVPGLAFLLAASYFFLRGLATDRRRYYALAFTLAGAAFLCRVTTAGVLPGWFLYGAWRYRPRKVLTAPLLTAAGIYLAAAASWTLLAARFGRYEVAADGRGSLLSGASLAYFAACLPLMASWGSSLLALAGAGRVLSQGRGSPAGLFWLTWLAGFSAFKLLMATTPEVRHFFMALPALAGLAACLLDRLPAVRLARPAAGLLLLAALGLNVVHLRQLPAGVVGYAAVGRCLAALPEPGNILLACPEDQELIFRYRASGPLAQRRMVRGDRALAIRVPEYAGVPTQPLAHTEQDVIEVLRRGRIRYVVTSCPDQPRQERWTEEMALAHRTAGSRPEQFILLGQFPLAIDYGGPVRSGPVFVWRFTGELPAGVSELPIFVPTARLTLHAPAPGRRPPTDGTP